MPKSGNFSPAFLGSLSPAATDIKKVIEIIRENYANYSKIKFYKATPNRNKYIIEKQP